MKEAHVVWSATTAAVHVSTSVREPRGGPAADTTIGKKKRRERERNGFHLWAATKQQRIDADVNLAAKRERISQSAREGGREKERGRVEKQQRRKWWASQGQAVEFVQG